MILSNKRAPGFTLIEVILAITILSTLAILSTQAISRALKARTKIQAEVDDVSALRDSMRMIRTDLNLAFHHQDFEQEITDLASKKSSTGTSTPQNANFQGQQYQPYQQAPQNPSQPQRQTKRGDPVTHFSGDDEKMNFVTMNNGRTNTATVQADFIEVGYALKDCKNLSTQKTSGCLFRRVQSILDDDVTTGGNEIVMLENVSEFKLRYIGSNKQDWVKAWKSTKDSSDGATIGKFPDAVEVSLAVEREMDGKKRTYSMQFVVPIHNPNNIDKPSSSKSTQNGSDGSQPSNPSGVVN